jgi:hypothetical protein
MKLSWRWWSWVYGAYKQRPVHSRPAIGRRRSRIVIDSTMYEAGDLLITHRRRSAAGRPLAFQKPLYNLIVETVPCGPYEETFAGYRAAWWYQRRVMRDRERRGFYRPEDLFKGLYRPHPLQGGKWHGHRA